MTFRLRLTGTALLALSLGNCADAAAPGARADAEDAASEALPASTEAPAPLDRPVAIVRTRSLQWEGEQTYIPLYANGTASGLVVVNLDGGLLYGTGTPDSWTWLDADTVEICASVTILRNEVGFPPIERDCGPHPITGKELDLDGDGSLDLIETFSVLDPLFYGERPAAAAVDSPAPSPAPDSVLTPDGWGGLRIGMTRAQVVAAAGEDANPGAVGGPDPETCDEFRPTRAPDGVLVMIGDGRLTRISITGRTGIVTGEGISVGDSVAAVHEAYGDGAVSSPHPFQPAPAELLTVWRVPPPSPSARGIAYEITEDGRVLRVLAGDESIEYREGCV